MPIGIQSEKLSKSKLRECAVNKTIPFLESEIQSHFAQILNKVSSVCPNATYDNFKVIKHDWECPPNHEYNTTYELCREVQQASTSTYSEPAVSPTTPSAYDLNPRPVMKVTLNLTLLASGSHSDDCLSSYIATLQAWIHKNISKNCQNIIGDLTGRVTGLNVSSAGTTVNMTLDVTASALDESVSNQNLRTCAGAAYSDIEIFLDNTTIQSGGSVQNCNGASVSSIRFIDINLGCKENDYYLSEYSYCIQPGKYSCNTSSKAL